MWAPGFTFARRAARRSITWMTICVSGFPSPSHSTRAPRRWRASRSVSANRFSQRAAVLRLLSGDSGGRAREDVEVSDLELTSTN